MVSVSNNSGRTYYWSLLGIELGQVEQQEWLAIPVAWLEFKGRMAAVNLASDTVVFEDGLPK